MAHLLGGRHILHVICHLAVGHPAVRRLDEPVLVDPRKGREAVDETDIRAFRRLDRAHAAVVGRMHVAHLEASALAGQAARSQSRKAPLMRYFRQRIRLVHELRQLRGAEELAHGGGGGLRVDEVLRHDRVDLDGGHALLDGTLHAEQANAILVLHQLAYRADAAVAEMVDIVDVAAAVAQLHQGLDAGHDVRVGAGCGPCLRHRGRGACSS